MKKYSPIGELSEFATGYAETLSKTTGHIACITDKDTVIAISGGSKKEYLEKGVSKQLEQIMDEKENYTSKDNNNTAIPITNNENADKTVFNPNWGIDTSKYIVPVKYPSTEVIKKSLGIYQTELRKPIHTVFCLDYSGSMYGKGNNQLTEAMDYILNEEEASKNLLQFSSKDKITIIPFNHQILGEYTTEDGRNTKDLINKITSTSVSGGTDIYLPAMKGLEILSQEDLETYNVSIVLMTDGASNYNRLDELTRLYKQTGKDIPIFSIMFGEAEEEQLQDIADLTNAKIFDGKTNLLEAFKQVRGYN